MYKPHELLVPLSFHTCLCVAAHTMTELVSPSKGIILLLHSVFVTTGERGHERYFLLFYECLLLKLKINGFLQLEQDTEELGCDQLMLQ